MSIRKTNDNALNELVYWLVNGFIQWRISHCFEAWVFKIIFYNNS